MNLYLARHGEARSVAGSPERILTATGRTQVEKTGIFLSAHADVQVRDVMHSGKLRAEQTAEILAGFLKPAGGVTASDGLGPHADVYLWVNRLAEREEDVLLVGHLPHLGKLAGRLLGLGGDEEPIAFRPGGVACFARDEKGGWSVRWVVDPDMLPSNL